MKFDLELKPLSRDISDRPQNKTIMKFSFSVIHVS